MVNSRPSSQGNGAIPRLSVSTAPSPSSSSQSQAGPSSQIGSIGRRPLGARKRGVAAGLYVANPDNSDDDGSPVQAQSNSPIRTQSSPTGTGTATGTATGTGRTSYEGEYRGLPNIPHQSTPPLPPPQPDRHNHTARRAYTTPPEAPQVPQRPHDTRHSSLSAQGQGQGQGQHSQSNVPPPSPSRLSRHALPSPPTHSSPTTQESRRLPQAQTQTQPNPNIRMSSPEEGFSPVVEGGSGFRPRAGSFNTSAKRLLQVTTDNEQFTLVDITGMNTAEAIRDRIFSKLRFRDDEYSNLSLQQTEYGEDPDPNTLSHDQLCQLCLSRGDSKASLKFLVIQGVPSSSAAVVPPADMSRERPIVSPIRTDLPKQHSHSGSIGSESDVEARRISQFRKSQASSTRSPHTSSISSSSFIPTPPPPHVELPDHTPVPSFTPAPAYASSSAGPSRPSASGSGSGWGLGLDTQDEMDPETAALIAQLQFEDQEERQREDERRRQLQADEELARKEQQSEAQEWQAHQHEQEQRVRLQREQMIRDESRAREIAAEERRIEQEGTFRSDSTYRGPSDRRGTYDRAEEFANDRRNRREQWSATGRMARGSGEIDDWARDTGTHQYPSVNPLFQPGTYQSPPNQYTPEVPTPAYRSDLPPNGFNRGYSETAHAQGRLNDQSLQEVQGRRSTAANVNVNPPRRQGLHPYAYSQEAARSVDNLRPYTPQPQSRPYNVAPPRPSATPQPDRTFPQPNIYRTPSAEHAQDGRYPDPARTNSIPFPSPQPRGSFHEVSPPTTGLRRPTSRPSSLHDSPPLGSSSSLLPRRPNTLHDHSPPDSAQPQPQSQDEYYRPDWQPRSASAGTQSYRDVSPTDRGPERLPYERASHTEGWLSVPGRHDSGDTASSSGMSEATEVQRSVEEENSNDTARQKDWTAIMGDLIGNAKGPAAGIAGGTGAVEDEEEATLFLPSSAQNSLSRRQIARSPPSKPHLTVDTRTNSPSQPATDSATDSETETTGGGRVQRGKSFARPEPGQWHTRPEPEQLYDRLDKYFPKVDLDQPIVDNPASTPSTPGESPLASGSGSGLPPPPSHPSRTPNTTTYEPNPMISPRTEPIPRAPPMHPARSAFNKAENRKSIRVMADYKRKTLQKDHQPKETSTIATKDKDEMKLSRRMSMWGHRVVEVTASKLNLGQIPLSTPESPAETEDTSKPQTLNWVKGELIGKGSYGRVYIALNISTGDMMAVKQVELPATERDRNDRKQLGQIESLRVEIALLKDMYHPNIVAYLGFETSPEYLSIFLEYVPGGTIATIYRTPNQARFEADLVKYFTQQILEGLEYLHRKHIWHRDLKGDNILVDLNGICKISDFGISKQTADAYDSFGQATNMKGSVFWMAPEVLHTVHNDRSYSGKVDIWSLGCVVIEMWSGKRPWGDLEQIPAMMQLFKREKPPLPNDVNLDDNSLDFLNTQCLALDPKDRPTASELLHHPFITSRNPKWSFKDSKIGRNVANTTPKTMSTTTTTSSGGSSTLRP